MTNCERGIIMNSVYLVDFLSVGEKGLRGIEKTDPTDKIYLYFSAAVSRAAQDTIMILRSYKDRIVPIETGVLPSMSAIPIAEAFGQMISDKSISAVFVISVRNCLKLLFPMKNTEHVPFAVTDSIESCSRVQPMSEEKDTYSTDSGTDCNDIGFEQVFPSSEDDTDDDTDDDFISSVNSWDQD